MFAATEGYVREVIHAFNDTGFAPLDPKWSGGWPRKYGPVAHQLICQTPTASGMLHRVATTCTASSSSRAGPAAVPQPGSIASRPSGRSSSTSCAIVRTRSARTNPAAAGSAGFCTTVRAAQAEPGGGHDQLAAISHPAPATAPVVGDRGGTSPPQKNLLNALSPGGLTNAGMQI